MCVAQSTKRLLTFSPLRQPYTVGWNDFNNFLVPNHKWKINSILIHNWKKKIFRFCEPFCVRLASKLAKKLMWPPKKLFSTNFDMGVKKAEFYAAVLLETKQFCVMLTRWKKVNMNTFSRIVRVKVEGSQNKDCTKYNTDISVHSVTIRKQYKCVNIFKERF